MLPISRKIFLEVGRYHYGLVVVALLRFVIELGNWDN